MKILQNTLIFISIICITLVYHSLWYPGRGNEYQLSYKEIKSALKYKYSSEPKKV